MAPPNPSDDLKKLLLGPLQGQPNAPEKAGVGASPVTHQRNQIRNVATAMRSELAALKYALTALDGGCDAVGDWDVAQSLGTKVGAAHQNMVKTVQAYCQAYEAVIRRVEQTAATYGKAEDAAQGATRPPAQHLGQPAPPPTSVVPWRTR